MTDALGVFSTIVSTAGFSPEQRAALESVPLVIASDFVRFTYRELKNNPLAHKLIVDICGRSSASEFPLSEWLSQVVRMYSWLEERNSSAKFCDVLEYISCAFDGSSLQPGHNLDWYLAEYGFERCVKVL